MQFLAVAPTMKTVLYAAGTAACYGAMFPPKHSLVDLVFGGVDSGGSNVIGGAVCAVAGGVFAQPAISPGAALACAALGGAIGAIPAKRMKYAQMFGVATLVIGTICSVASGVFATVGVTKVVLIGAGMGGLAGYYLVGYFGGEKSPSDQPEGSTKASGQPEASAMTSDQSEASTTNSDQTEASTKKKAPASKSFFIVGAVAGALVGGVAAPLLGYALVKVGCVAINILGGISAQVCERSAKLFVGWSVPQKIFERVIGSSAAASIFG